MDKKDLQNKGKHGYFFIYFNTHYGGKAIVNSLQFKELINNQPLPEIEKRVMEKAKKYLSNTL